MTQEMSGAGFYWHPHHNKVVEWCWDYDERRRYIENEKPEEERALRLRLFRPATGLPHAVVKAGRVYDKALRVYEKAWQVYDKVGRARGSAGFDKAWQAYDKAGRAQQKLWRALEDELQKAKRGILALHAEQCPDCPWDGETIFRAMPDEPEPKEKK